MARNKTIRFRDRTGTPIEFKRVLNGSALPDSWHVDEQDAKTILAQLEVEAQRIAEEKRRGDEDKERAKQERKKRQREEAATYGVNKDVYEALLEHFLADEDPVNITSVASNQPDEEEPEWEFSIAARIYELEFDFFVLIVGNVNEEILDCLGPFDSLEEAESEASAWSPSG